MASTARLPIRAAANSMASGMPSSRAHRRNRAGIACGKDEGCLSLLGTGHKERYRRVLAQLIG
jgi:hypothetical protein